MSSFLDVFERTEKKYVVPEKSFISLLGRMGEEVKPDAYGKGIVSSIYYDTPDSLIVNRSLEKPIYKEKLRLRSYGTPQTGQPVFVEIKKKFKGVVYKRRVVCTYDAALAFLQGGVSFEDAVTRYPLLDPDAQKASLEPKSIQISHEIGWFLKRYPGIAPAMMITCEREAFISTDGNGIRFTTDRAIQWRDTRLDFRDGLEGRPLIPSDERVMEIKSAGPYPFWLVDALDAEDIYPSSYSKYGNAFLAEQSDRGSLPYGRTAALRAGESAALDRMGLLVDPRSSFGAAGVADGRVAAEADGFMREGACCA